MSRPLPLLLLLVSGLAFAQAEMPAPSSSTPLTVTNETVTGTSNENIIWANAAHVGALDAGSVTIGAGSGAVGVGFSTPGARLHLGSASRYFTDNGTSAIILNGGPLVPATGLNLGATSNYWANVFGTNIQSNASSGNNGVTLTTNGARVDLGSGSGDYLSSNGTSALAGGNPILTGSTTSITDLDLPNAVATCTTATATVACTVGQRVAVAPQQDDAAWDTGSLTAFCESSNTVKAVYCGTGNPAATNDYNFTVGQ